MTPLETKGHITEEKGKEKQRIARKTGDPLKELEGKEEELAGKLQQKFGKDRERSEVKKKIEETDT